MSRVWFLRVSFPIGAEILLDADMCLHLTCLVSCNRSRAQDITPDMYFWRVGSLFHSLRAMDIHIISVFPRSRVNRTRHKIPDYERLKKQGWHAGNTKSRDGERGKKWLTHLDTRARSKGKETGCVLNHGPLPYK